MKPLTLPILERANLHGYFNADDGTSLYYEIRGHGSPLFLCYGLTCRMEHWCLQIPLLSKQYQVITMDYRGHQRSSVPRNDRNLSLRWCARDVVALAKHLGINRAVGLGHSMGVPVCLEAAQIAPELFSGLVLICGAIWNPFSHMFHSNRMQKVFNFLSPFFEATPELVEPLWKNLVDPNSFSRFVTSRFGFNPLRSADEMVTLYLKGVAETPAVVFYAFIKDYAERGSSVDSLLEADVPSLVIAGENDFITPIRVMKEMTRRMKQAEILIVRDGSHNAHVDFPQKVNEAIIKFLGKLKL